MNNIQTALTYIKNIEHFEDLELGSYSQLGEVKKTLAACEIAMKGAIAALTQNKAFPVDIMAAKAFLNKAL